MAFEKASLADQLREAGVHMFVAALAQVPGVKDLVLSPQMLTLLDSICGHQRLRSNEVDQVYKLDSSSKPELDCQHRIYVIRPYIDELKLVIDQINSYIALNDPMYDPSIECKFWVMFVPKLTYPCDSYLEEEGVYEHVRIIECPLSLIPLEHDLFSLENEHVYTSLFLEGDLTPLTYVVNSIMQIEMLNNRTPEIHGQGKFAKMIADQLEQIYSIKPTDSKLKEKENSSRRMDHQGKHAPYMFTDLFLVDRDVDIVSALLSQLNYEGVLDEAFGIKCAKIEFGPNVTKSIDKPIVKHSLLGESEPIYRDIRDQHFTTVFTVLKVKYGEMKEKYTKSQTMDLSSLANFVAKELKLLQAEFKCLALHISACEEIVSERNRYDWAEQLIVEQNIIEGIDSRRSMNYIERCIERQVNPRLALRLLCLLSLSQGGLGSKDYQTCVTIFCQSYGYSHITTFHHLKRLGLFTEQPMANSFFSSANLSGLVSGSTSASSSALAATFTGAVSSLTEAARGKVVDTVGVRNRTNFAQLVKRFQLVPETGDKGYNVRQPTDCAFVFGGAYIPLVCQLVSGCVLNYKPMLVTPEAMKLLAGPNFQRKTSNSNSTSSVTLSVSNASMSSNLIGSTNSMPSISTSSSNNCVTSNCKRGILIYLIGGITYAEMSALRFLAQQRNVNIAVATTSIINGNRLISSLMPKDCDKIYQISN